MRIILINIIFSLSLSSCAFNQNHYLNYEIPLKTLIDSFAIKKSSLHVLIDKSEYKLVIFSDTTIIKEYPVVFGGNPTSDKLMEGDQCTPEGIFYMVSKYPHKDWSKFIWINYPTNDSWKKHNNAIQDGIIPKDAKIGGEIGIHGVPNGMDKSIDLKYNWTLGCISLKNKDVDEIYPYITEETKIVISK